MILILINCFANDLMLSVPLELIYSSILIKLPLSCHNEYDFISLKKKTKNLLFHKDIEFIFLPLHTN